MPITSNTKMTGYASAISLVNRIYKDIQRRFSLLQLILLQQVCFCLILIVIHPVNQINLNVEELSRTLKANRVSTMRPDEWAFLFKLLQKQAAVPQVIVFRNLIIIVGFALTLFLTLKHSPRSSKTMKTEILFGIFVWLLLCFNVFLPLKFAVSSKLDGPFSYLQHPLSSITFLVMAIASLPFSLVTNSPVTFDQVQIVELTEKIAQYTEGRISLTGVGTSISNLYTITYNWGIVIPLIVFVGTCVMLTEQFENSKLNESTANMANDMEELIEIGKVHKLSVNYEKKETAKNQEPCSKVANVSNNKLVQEEKIKPAAPCSLLKNAKPAVTLAKVRPVNVTKPLNVHSNTHSSDTVPNIKPEQSESEIKASIGDRIKIFKGLQETTAVEEVVETSNVRKVENVQTSHVPKLPECFTRGIQVSPCTKHFSQHFQLVQNTKDASQQCDEGKNCLHHESSGQQTDDVTTAEKAVHCELLSQERFTKLQQSALALYKKTVDKQKQDFRRWNSLPKKVQVSSVVTKYNKSVQVSLQINTDPSNGYSVRNGGLTVSENQSPGSLLVNSEAQTDLYGYVLDKIIQERETGNVYSKLDLEKTVHSVITLNDKIKQHTETIRFKAMKSQHGVWYVSLRGDIFLTISQDILKNVKLNTERKVETEVTSDILRAMKLFVDNYNKLSDCFEDDEESDDESFINGFRL